MSALGHQADHLPSGHPCFGLMGGYHLTIMAAVHLAKWPQRQLADGATEITEKLYRKLQRPSSSNCTFQFLQISDPISVPIFDPILRSNFFLLKSCRKWAGSKIGSGEGLVPIFHSLHDSKRKKLDTKSQQKLDHPISTNDFKNWNENWIAKLDHGIGAKSAS